MNPGGSRLAGAVLVLAGCLAAPAAAQVVDTLRTPPDTLAADTAAQDSVQPPPPLFVPFPSPDTTDAALGVWHLDRAEMLRASVFTLADLLARIPSVTSFRTGLVLQPEAAGAFGGAGGRMEILRDGFPLDPLDASIFDLSRVSLIDVAEVVVERRPGLLRVHLVSAQPVDARPYSRVEATLGEPEIEGFRGIFLTPGFLIGPLGLAVERLNSDGEGGSEPADAFVGWARWGWIRENAGIQLELWQNSINRQPEVPWPTKHVRRDIVVRARARLADSLVAEVYAGQSSVEEESLAEPPADGEDVVLPALDRSSRQLGMRAAWERGTLRINGALRHRNVKPLPRLELDLSGATELLGGRLQLEAGVIRSGWRDHPSTMSLRGAGSFRLTSFFRAFAEYETGTRGLRFWPDPQVVNPEGDSGIEFEDSVRVRSDLTAARLGGELNWRGVRAGAAFLDQSVDSVGAFGLPFDSAFRALPGGEARGWEAWGRADLARFWGGTLYLEGSWLSWMSGTAWDYRPAARGVVGAGIHIVPLESGNLEVRARLWADHRGETRYPVVAEDGVRSTLPLPARTAIHADLMLRIIDVLIFARLEDWRGEDMTDVPGRTIGGPRLFYGVKWHFWN